MPLALSRTCPFRFRVNPYDSNNYAYTTNFFQLYDVGLTNGTNRIIVHATDLAGNSTTTNFSFNFTLTVATNAPVLSIYWPSNGNQLSGSNFTVRGSIDNATATIVAQVVNTNGVTNIVPGTVERNGLFWANALPLSPGTNFVTITATDAAGNTTVTNLNVMGNSVIFTVGPIDPSVLYQSSITVTGTNSDLTDYTVWVNGVAASIDGSGNWTANYVPLNDGGTVIVQARAIPNADTSTGGGGTPTSQYSANPNSPNALTVELEGTRGVSTIVGTYNLSIAAPFPIHSVLDWTETATYFWDSFGSDSYYTATSHLPAPNDFTNTVKWPDPKNPTNTPAPTYAEHSDVNAPIPALLVNTNGVEYNGTLPWQRNGDGTAYVLIGGLGNSQSLYQLAVSATIITNDYWFPGAPGGTPGYAAQPSEITAAGQTPDSDGNIYTFLAANTTNPVPVHVGKQFHVDSVSPSEVQLTSLTVISNAAQIGGTNNWAAVKTTSNEWVYVQATLSVTNQGAGKQIRWSGGQEVSGDPFQRRVSKGSPDMTTVKASLGSSSLSLEMFGSSGRISLSKRVAHLTLTTTLPNLSTGIGQRQPFITLTRH